MHFLKIMTVLLLAAFQASWDYAGEGLDFWKGPFQVRGHLGAGGRTLYMCLPLCTHLPPPGGFLGAWGCLGSLSASMPTVATVPLHGEK